MEFVIGEPTPTARTYRNVTLYRAGDFMGNYHGIRCKSATVWAVKVGYGGGWAVNVTYMEKGKRKERGFSQSSHYSIVIVAGWDSPEPAGIFNAPRVTESGVSVSEGRYSSFSGGWRAEFERDILPACTVLANYHGFDPVAAAKRRAAEIDPATATLPLFALADYLRDRNEEYHADMIQHAMKVA